MQVTQQTPGLKQQKKMLLIIKNLDNHQQLGFNNKEVVDLTTKLLGAWTLKIDRFLTDQPVDFWIILKNGEFSQQICHTIGFYVKIFRKAWLLSQLLSFPVGFSKQFCNTEIPT